MARRTKRRPRVVWLPPDINNRVATSNPIIAPFQSGLGTFLIDANGGTGTITGGLVAVVKDEPALGVLAETTLADSQSSGYRLRRLVGKVFVGIQQIAAADDNLVDAATITAGFIILRVDDAGAPLQSPIDLYMPNRFDSWSDPWIWRRSWKLSVTANAILPGSSQNGTLWPENNANYGSAVDGPHVDQKTARVISQEERLFFVMSAVAEGGNVAATTAISAVLDIRVLATMRTNSGNRNNSSR